MRLPEFTAEASLGKISEDYVLSLGAKEEAGRVLPQGYYVRQSRDGVDIVYCEAGICISHHVRTVYTMM
jgi:hypothetical protein